MCGGLIGPGVAGEGDKRLGPPLLVIMEGWDAAGKGGAIRRLTEAIDPRHATVAPFAVRPAARAFCGASGTPTRSAPPSRPPMNCLRESGF